MTDSPRNAGRPRDLSLDQIIEIATKANQAINIISPGAGTIGSLGVELVKFITDRVNEARAQAGSDPIVLPPVPELIDRMEATANRIVEKGQTWLDEGD